MLEEYLHEIDIADACQMETFANRMEGAGLSSLLDGKVPPRKRCAVFKRTYVASSSSSLIDEAVQRTMIKAIDPSIPS